MSDWPQFIPYDLKCKLEELAGRRYTASDQDRWAVVKEWLEGHGLEAPEHQLPVEPELPLQRGH